MLRERSQEKLFSEDKGDEKGKERPYLLSHC